MSWKDDYLERYKKLKAQGKSFFPYAVFKDIVVVLLIFSALLWVAYKYYPTLEALADPTDSNYNPRPEWYFLFLFQALKMFPGKLESIASVFLPGFAVLLLFSLPFIDRGPERHPFRRPFFTIFGVSAICFVSYLTYLGATSPLTNPIVEKDPLVEEGQRLYQSLNCAYCHKMGGKGGVIGPELDKVAGNESEEWLSKHFKDPRSVNPGSTMPKLNLLDDEIRALVAYMKSLGSAPFTEEAPKLFAENCAACHKIGTEGNDIGPDLSLIGSARNKAYIKRYIANASKFNPATAMPAFEDQLTDVQIEDLSRYLSQQK